MTRFTIDIDGEVVQIPIACTAVDSGWAYVQLPGMSTLPEDPEVVDRLVGFAVRLLGRGAEVASELTDGEFESLRPDRIAIGVPHTVQRDAVRDALDAAEITGVRVDTANRLQGLEFDVVLAWHPLAGLRAPTNGISTLVECVF